LLFTWIPTQLTGFQGLPSLGRVLISSQPLPCIDMHTQKTCHLGRHKKENKVYPFSALKVSSVSFQTDT